MEIGLGLPTTGVGVSRHSLEAGAQVAVDLGWTSVWATDHLMVPTGAEADEYGAILEAIVSLTHVAARHPDLRIGTSVIVPPMRNPVILAKQFATIDELTEGRLIVGVGVADRSDLAEFRNLGMEHRMRGRGAFVDESIRMWRHLWSGDTSPFVGEFFELADFVFEPLPPQGANLPIWTGGRSDRALRRAIELADGYHAARTGPEDVLEKKTVLERLAAEHNTRLPTISVRARVRFEQEPGDVYTMCGSDDDVAGEVRRFAEAGTDHLIVVLEETDPRRIRMVAERFHQNAVVPALG
jgi:alkanesulfonate monooxygenase SsuD/methylene tetrahydromethanopterin reductase-like flavin-dependent oxidoreductase (luciferase family)